MYLSVSVGEELGMVDSDSEITCFNMQVVALAMTRKHVLGDINVFTTVPLASSCIFRLTSYLSHQMWVYSGHCDSQTLIGTRVIRDGS